MDFYKKVKDIFDVLSTIEQTDKYIYIMDLGKKLKVEENIIESKYLIKDCASAAYIKITINDGKMDLIVDSSSMFVKGLLYLLKKCFDKELISDIKDFKIDAFMKATNLGMHITSQRLIGFGGALKEIKKEIYHRVRSNMKIEPKLTLLVLEEDGGICIQCLQYDIAAQGKTVFSALESWGRTYQGEVQLENLEKIAPAPKEYWDVVQNPLKK